MKACTIGVLAVAFTGAVWALGGSEKAPAPKEAPDRPGTRKEAPMNAARDEWSRPVNGLRARVVLFEKDDMHPDGQAFIGDDRVHLVGRTAEVERLLANKELEEVDDDGAPRKRAGRRAGPAAAAPAPSSPVVTTGATETKPA